MPLPRGEPEEVPAVHTTGEGSSEQASSRLLPHSAEHRVPVFTSRAEQCPPSQASTITPLSNPVVPKQATRKMKNLSVPLHPALHPSEVRILEETEAVMSKSGSLSHFQDKRHSPSRRGLKGYKPKTQGLLI